MMSDLKFSFCTDSYADQFELISYNGTESMSQMFEFSLSLKVKKELVSGLDFQTAVSEGCKIAIKGIDGQAQDYEIIGILKTLDEEFQGSNSHKYFTAVMVPSLWRQSKNKSYDIYVDQTVDVILEDELSNDVLSDHQLSLSQVYPAKPFICQYSESNFDFVTRLANHWGIYYYFDHIQQGKLIFADDTNYDPAAIPQANIDISNNPSNSFNTVRTLKRTFHATPTGVVVSEINPDQASEHFSGQAGDVTGKSCVHLVNESCDDIDESNLIAAVRLEEYQCDAIEYIGTSGIPCLAPGFILKVIDDEGIETDILLTSVTHSASNLDDSNRVDGKDGAQFYESSFTGIPSTVQYRPQHDKVKKPQAISTMARIHSDDNKKNIAQRNDVGKYQVIFDFLKDEKKISQWVRLARPSARTNHFDMPLTPGTEVQMAFIGGNPDRPFIQSALENSQSVVHSVTNANPHHTAIRTDGMLYTETAKSRQEFHVSESHDISEAYGLRNNKPFQELDYAGTESGDPVDEITGKHHLSRRFGDHYSFVQGNDYTYADGKCTYNFGNDYTENHAYDESVISPNTFDIEGGHLYSSDSSQASDSSIEASKQVGLVEKTFGNTYNYHAGIESNWAKGPDGTSIHKTFNYGGRYEENQATDYEARDDSMSGFPSGPSDDDLVTKTFGNTFELQEGDQTSVLTGNVISEMTGDTDETITGSQTANITGDITETILGNQESTITGDTTETITGAITSTHTGDVTSTHIGMTTETVTGDSVATYTGSVSETIASAYSGTKASASVELVGGAYSSTYVGAALEVFAGGKIETHQGMLITNEKGEMCKREMNVEDVKTAIKKAKVNIVNATLTMIG